MLLPQSKRFLSSTRPLTTNPPLVSPLNSFTHTALLAFLQHQTYAKVKEYVVCMQWGRTVWEAQNLTSCLEEHPEEENGHH